MSATDTQVLAALKDDAWEGHDEPLTSADLERIAKVATEAIGRDADRLRNGIKALITMHESKAAEFYAELSGPKHSWTPRQHTCDTIARGHTLAARDLRALLDGEAKG